MAADFIVVTRTSRPAWGTRFIEAANKLKELRELVDGLNDAAGHMVNAADYTVFEAQFGLTAGVGANAVTLLGLLNTILNTSGEVTGANRLAQLDEFQARLAGQ